MKISIGRTIQSLHKEYHITQEMLASYLNVTAQAISRWEQELSYPDTELLPKIASFFNISLDTLFSYQEKDIVFELVMKYCFTYDEYFFTSAERILLQSIKNLPVNLENYVLLTHLYYQRSLEMLEKAIHFNQILIEKSDLYSDTWQKGKKQMILYNRMLQENKKNYSKCNIIKKEKEPHYSRL